MRQAHTTTRLCAVGSPCQRGLTDHEGDVRRRQFIAGLGGAVVGTRGVWAQAKVYALGILETVPRAQNHANFAALLNGLRELGYGLRRRRFIKNSLTTRP